jgi:hypothetical protein
MPEPLRQAHILATNTMKDKIKWLVFEFWFITV